MDIVWSVELLWMFEFLNVSIYQRRTTILNRTNIRNEKIIIQPNLYFKSWKYNSGCQPNQP